MVEPVQGHLLSSGVGSEERNCWKVCGPAAGIGPWELCTSVPVHLRTLPPTLELPVCRVEGWGCERGRGEVESRLESQRCCNVWGRTGVSLPVCAAPNPARVLQAVLPEGDTRASSGAEAGAGAAGHRVWAADEPAWTVEREARAWLLLLREAGKMCLCHLLTGRLQGGRSGKGSPAGPSRGITKPAHSSGSLDGV